jgi:hypothetical protein
LALRIPFTVLDSGTCRRELTRYLRPCCPLWVVRVTRMSKVVSDDAARTRGLAAACAWRSGLPYRDNARGSGLDDAVASHDMVGIYEWTASIAINRRSREREGSCWVGEMRDAFAVSTRCGCRNLTEGIYSYMLDTHTAPFGPAFGACGAANLGHTR